MKILSMIITNLCNMNCAFCLRGKDPSSIDLKTVKKILDEAKTLGYDTVALTGGEAWMHPKFYELIDLIVKEGFDFTIVSNAKNYEKYIPLLDKHKSHFKIITFSLDGNEKTHDTFRGRGSYQKVLEAAKFFSDKTYVIITMCINKFNMSQIIEVLNTSELIGAKQINYSSVIPTGKNDPYVLSDKEREDCMRIINSFRDKSKLKVRTLSGLKTHEGIVEFCGALNLDSISVNPKGQLSFCCDTTGNGAIIGDLKKEKLSKAMEKGLRISNYLKQKRYECMQKGIKFEGFNTCYFCNKYLDKYKKK
jgi:MoaA/NifB/PqqE/SkfB family radical SAM enzyme